MPQPTKCQLPEQPARRNRNILFTPEKDAEVRARYEQGGPENSTKALGREYGVTFSTVIAAVVRAGGRMRTPAENLRARLARDDGPRRMFSDEYERAVTARYDAGESGGKLAREAGVTHITVMRWVEKWGGGKRKHSRTHTLREDAFDGLELAGADPTGEARYWTGMMMADGCLHHRKAGFWDVSLALKDDDRAHVEAFRAFLGSTHTIGTRDNSQGYGDGFSAQLSVRSTRLAEALLRYGVKPRKSRREYARLLAADRFFWCGALCGDGSLGVGQDGRPWVGLVGSKALLDQFLAWARTVSPTDAAPQYEGSIWSARVNGAPSVAVVRGLFADSPFALPRKLAIAQRIIRECDEDGYLKPEFGGTGVRRPDYSDVTPEAVRESFMRHGNWPLVAAELGMPLGTLHKWRQRWGIPLGKPEHRDWSWLTPEFLLEKWQALRSWKAVAESIGMRACNLSTFRRRLGMIP